MSKPIPAIALFALSMIPSSVRGQPPAPERIRINGGVELHFVRRGAGEPVVFVHGLLSDHSFWTRQLDGFAREGFQAIAYSRRYNHPNKNELRTDHSAVVEAEDLAELIRKLKLEKVHVVGFSYGAYTGLMLALNHPELVQTLTLAEPPIASWLNELPGVQAESGRKHMTKLMNEGIQPTKEAFESQDTEKALRTMFDCIGGEGAFGRLPEFVKHKCRQNQRELLALVSSDDPYPMVDRRQVQCLAVPTLILSGGKSVATAKYTDPELERLLPEQTRRRIVLKDATHAMWVEQPVDCRNVVIRFLRNR